MTCYVDELRQWPTKLPCFQNGSCHLTADTEDELHEMARALGMKREWYQNHKILPYYEISPNRRKHAVTQGAVYSPTKIQLRKARKLSAQTSWNDIKEAGFNVASNRRLG